MELWKSFRRGNFGTIQSSTKINAVLPFIFANGGEGSEEPPSVHLGFARSVDR